MRRWLTAAIAGADLVAGRAATWLPGALAWSLTGGWIPLLVAVAWPPSISELTFLGARIYSSGAWPWNAVAIGAGALLAGAIGFVLVAVAEALLIGSPRRVPMGPGLGRLLGIGFITAAPVLATLLAAAMAFVIVAVREFNAPNDGGPLLRSLGRIAPFVVAVGVAWLVAGAAHAAASRRALLEGAGLVDALAAVPGRLWRAGITGLVHALAVPLFRVAYLVVAALLLSVLWDPIAGRLDRGGIDAAVLPLLVGFVAIWLCLVLGGGALHAWGSVTWTRVLGTPASGRGGAERREDGDPHRP
jgi:hypothetical protein